MVACIARRTRSADWVHERVRCIDRGIRGRGHPGASFRGGLFVVIPVGPALLVVASPHANVTSDANPAALLGDYAAERCALRETREFLGAVYHEWAGFDFQAVDDMRVPRRRRARRVVGLVVVFGVLQFFVQAEAKPVLALVSNREIRENEVPGGRRPVQIHHPGHGRAGEDDEPIRLLLRHPAMGHRPGLFQRGEEEIVGVHVERDVAVGAIPFVDLQLHDGRRIHRPTVGGSCSAISECRGGQGRPGAGGLPSPPRAVVDLHLAPAPHALAR